ncbi:hypothetical protein EWM64_g3850 [Hericium alpestre]|uniref:Major facilitator superfamily (MFS) profile domain-containing protein n=1 Tax=Hericium alpestre TaxID=135208 RepID=A0A4Z0A0B1_9AGAM|nr:hypothetical protein EWM64_g3850 [Hericium alpestre]
MRYLCNNLDRGNIGNAKTDGWDKDIHLTGNQYYLLVMIFYIPLCFIFIKRFSAARVLPIMMIGFGSMALCTAAAKNFSQVFALRFLLGLFESAMLPGVVFYLSTFYKRNELASRVGLFYAAYSIAGAFSGLIAFGVFHIQNSKYHAWHFLFWIEGCVNPLESKGVAYFACFLLCMGAFSPLVLVASWYSNNTLSENHRVVVAAVMVGLANAAGLISTNVFKAKDEPKYVPALITSAVFSALCIVLTVGLGFCMRWENRRRNKEQGINVTAADISTEGLKDGIKSSSFHFMY